MSIFKRLWPWSNPDNSLPKKQPMLSISTDRPTLEITLPDGTVTAWKYDVVVLKLKIQQIQEQTGRTAPNQEDLALFKDCLIGLGMPDCNIDVALRIWSLVIVQFQQVALSIAKQIEECR